MFFSKKTKNKFHVKRVLHRDEPLVPFKEKYGLHFFNFTQFFGALNDNIYKFLSVFLLIDMKGIEHSSTILFLVGVIYVFPFLLFSSIGGILADRFSKQKIIIAMKALEILVMLGAVIAFATRSEWGIYSMLFMLSAQSAFFGPPKYSVIPEIVDPQRIAKANGLITSSTYLAIILGSFLASFVTQITNKNFVLTAMFCLVIAIVGFITSILIPKTKSQKQKQKITPLFIRDIYKTLQYCRTKRYFLLAISGSFFFLFIGAFIQLNIVPFGMESLGLSEVGGGYLFLSCAIGIALGAVVAGRTKKKKGNLGLACLALCVTAIFCFILPVVTFSLIITVIALMALGFGGGLFVVPIDSFIQTYSPDEKRGKIVAASNFMSFCGVLLAPICIYIFGGLFHLSAASGFFLMGLITLGYFCVIARKISGIFLNYASRKLLYPFFHVEMRPSDFDIKSIKSLIAPARHISYAALIMGLRTKFHLYIAKPKKKPTDIIWRLFKNIHFIYYETSPQYIIETFDRVLKLNANPDIIPCLIVNPSNQIESSFKDSDFQNLKAFFYAKSSFVNIKECKRTRKKMAKFWKPVQIILDFQDKKNPTFSRRKHLLSGIFSKRI